MTTTTGISANVGSRERGWIVRSEDDGLHTTLEDFGTELLDDIHAPAGDEEANPSGADVAVRIEYSSLNYKDALSLRERPGIARRFPLVVGLDIVGEVIDSADPRWAPGDRVALLGSAHGETQHGGLATRAHVRGSELVAIPETFTTRQAAAIGSAGVTSALSVLALRRHGITPRSGPVVVTGASGGVGTTSITLLARAGFEVVAATGRPEEQGASLRALGAARVVHRDEIAGSGRPLQSQTWAGGVDTVGGPILAGLLAQTRQRGAVAACGLAASSELHTTVMPFILRAVSILGINAVHITPEERRELWELLARDLAPEVLDSLTRQVALADVQEAAAEILDGHGTGRVVVDCREA